MRYQLTSKAFTLAELLIALAILGVIATFTIPKILESGSDSKFNSIAKEAAGMVSGAYQNYKLENTASASTTFGDLTPYMNYVKVDTAILIDATYNSTTADCGTVNTDCIVLHNGAILLYITSSFTDTSSTSALIFNIDPDGKVTTTGAAGTPGKALPVSLYYNCLLYTSPSPRDCQ